jgi:hypothetical protein
VTPKTQPTDVGGGPGGGNGGVGSVLLAIAVSLAFVAALLALFVVGFLTWWRTLYRGTSPVSGRLARVARLGAWTGRPPRRDQTPYEYADQLGRAVPDASEPVRGLTELYVRERWGGRPATAGESAGLYEQARVALTRAIIQRWHEVVDWLLLRLAPVTRPFTRTWSWLVRQVNRLIDFTVREPGT